jgi:hypothetical protein
MSAQRRANYLRDDLAAITAAESGRACAAATWQASDSGLSSGHCPMPG